MVFFLYLIFNYPTCHWGTIWDLFNQSLSLSVAENPLESGLALFFPICADSLTKRHSSLENFAFSANRVLTIVEDRHARALFLAWDSAAIKAIKPAATWHNKLYFSTDISRGFEEQSWRKMKPEPVHLKVGKRNSESGIERRLKIAHKSSEMPETSAKSPREQRLSKGLKYIHFILSGRKAYKAGTLSPFPSLKWTMNSCLNGRTRFKRLKKNLSDVTGHL